MKQVKKFILLKNCADAFIEVGKLVIAGFVIGGVLSDDAKKFFIVSVGATISLFLLATGIFIKTHYEIK
jgi:glutamate mutase epsilon subunit